MKITKLLTFFILIMVMISCRQQPAFDHSDFAAFPVYKGNDPEMVWTPEKTDFRIYAPTAEAARVKIYEKGLGGASTIEKNMKTDVDGTWIASIENNLNGKFYTFQIKYKGAWLQETPGIFATSTGVNGIRGAIVDMKTTDPDGWENDQKPPLQNYNDIIIYELHVRDMSIHPESGIINKGKYAGLTETGTISPQGEKTGIDHIEELGVTHVHILPAFDFRSIDETRLSDKVYNWGYDPENYNVPEGSYATDPYDPKSRISEFKAMVKTFHNKGIRVIMDVVYNHTGKTDDSNFSLLVPGYYYRHNDDGSCSNASGCGNETASERPMMRKYMIASLKHWAEEYHVDGFRFDLMGIHDIETMNMLSEEMHKIDPTIFIYGEGWTAGGSPLPLEQQALKRFTYKLDSVAAFSDDIRDGIKGSWSDHESKGFVSGAPDLEESIKFGIVASTQHPQIDYSKVNYSKEPWAAEPYQTISYVSCHDNHTLFDKLKISNPGDDEVTLIKKHKLANTIVMTSQGVPFLHAGVDFLRTKQDVENSYNRPDSINQIYWPRKAKYRIVFDYYRDLIKLRKNHPAFRMSSTKDIQKNLEFLAVDTPNVVAYELKNFANGDSWKNIVVVFNGSDIQQIVNIPFGKWTEVFNESGLKSTGYRTFKHDKLAVPPFSAIILAEIVPEQY
ncbi:MAG: type I pullulanase [Bacteroidales bacterium]|nr:type I pullulanase [Bacteroidales bacterium]